MWIRRSAVAAAALSAVLMSACDPASPEDPAPAPPTPEATGSPAAQDGPFDYCELIDLAEATKIAGDLGDTGGEPLLLAQQYVSREKGWEICEYAATMAVASGVVALTVSPEGVLPDLPDEAEPREELGEGAYFEARVEGFPPGFSLGAPVADAFLILHVSSERDDVEPGQAEDALRGLLDAAAGRLPAGAALAELVAEEDCEEFEEATVRVLEGPPDHSRYVETDGSFSCELTSLEESWRAGVKLWLGAEEEYRPLIEGQPNFKELDLADAWLLALPGAQFAQVYAFTGPDLIRVDMRSAGGNEALVEELANEVVPIITGS